MNKGRQIYKAIVIGASAGGMKVVKSLCTSLPQDFTMGIAIVQHIADNSDNSWARMLDEWCNVKVKEADEKEPIKRGTVYLAPANYHLLVETDRTFTLTVDERVNYARPSIDVLFETAAEAFKEELIGVVFTGANFDGAQGLLSIKENGGLTIVQDPNTAEATPMPKAAIEKTHPDYILAPEDITDFLLKLDLKQKEVHQQIDKV